MLSANAGDIRQEFNEHVALCAAHQGALNAVHSPRESALCLGVISVGQCLNQYCAKQQGTVQCMPSTILAGHSNPSKSVSNTGQERVPRSQPEISRILVQHCGQKKGSEEDAGFSVCHQGAPAFAESRHASTIAGPIVRQLGPPGVESCSHQYVNGSCAP